MIKAPTFYRGKARVPLFEIIPLTAIAGEARDWRRRLTMKLCFKLSNKIQLLTKNYVEENFRV
ncbi:hypothetical protein BLOT_016869 [Blomia tropicalis]|nr:hypothetical protein BLOT_016869 [Blomia tropicalis]